MVENSLPSGAKEAIDGSKYVGGSVRADGTVRKTFKVRPGYTPPEDVPRYIPRKKREQTQESKSSSVSESNTETKKIVATDNTESVTKVKPDTLTSNQADQNPTNKPNHKKESASKEPKDPGKDVENIESLLNKLDISNDKKAPSASSAKPKDSKSVYIPPWKRKQLESQNKKD